MGRKSNVFAALLVSLMVTGSLTVYADIFKGEIKGINADSGLVIILPKDPATGTIGIDQLQVQTSSKTKLENFASLNELRLGDELKVDGKQDKKSGICNAKSLSVTKVQIQQ